MKNSSPIQSHYYSWIAMIFVTMAICDVLLVYRLVSIGRLIVTAGVFVMPIYYMLQDVVAEIYGYHAARKMIVMMIICMYIFSAIITIGIHLPFPTDWQAHNSQYQFVLGHLIRRNVLGLLSVLAGAFANVILITKWKALVRGRYFWMRSIGASAVGETLASIVGSYVLYFDVYSNKEIFDLIWPVCILLIIQNIFYSFIGAIIVWILKRKEPHLQPNVNVNPFASSN